MVDAHKQIKLFLPSATVSLCMNDWTIRLYVVYVYLTLQREGYDVIFDDHLTKQGDFEAALVLLGTEEFSGIYGVAMFLGNKKNGLRLMREIRKKEPGAMIVAFGPFAAVFYKRILEEDLADVVILSDAEFVFPIVCADRSGFSDIPNIAYRQDGAISVSVRKEFDALDLLPFAGQYFCEKGDRSIPIITARGCSFHCSFCDRPFLWGGRVRSRSTGNVLDEVGFLAEHYQLRRVFFDDADFLADRKRAALLCQEFTKLSFHFAWKCSTRVDSVNKEILALMRYAGCDTVYFGVESADEGMLKKFGKSYGRGDVVQAVRSARDVGLKVGIFLIIGGPGESKETVKETKDLLLEIAPFSELNINPLVVLPGTRLFSDLMKSGQIAESDYFEEDKLVLFDRNFSMYTEELGPLTGFLEVPV